MLRLRELRKQKGISQQYLANLMGVTQATLSGWETGRYEVDSSTLRKLAAYFDVSVDYLLGISKTGIVAFLDVVLYWL